jgi:hypothetical protein
MSDPLGMFVPLGGSYLDETPTELSQDRVLLRVPVYVVHKTPSASY